MTGGFYHIIANHKYCNLSRAKASNNETITITYQFFNILQPMLDKAGLKAY